MFSGKDGAGALLEDIRSRNELTAACVSMGEGAVSSGDVFSCLHKGACGMEPQEHKEPGPPLKQILPLCEV